MATFTRRGDGYSVRWRDLDGTSRRRQVGSKRIAQQLVREIETAHDLGREWTPHTGRASPPLVGVDDHPGAIGLYLRDRRRVWAASTHEYRSVSLSIFGAWLTARDPRKRVPVDVLSRSLMAEYWDYLVSERKVSTATAGERVRHAEQLWLWCYDHEDWGEEVRRPRRLDVPSDPPKKTLAPTWAEMDAVILYAREAQSRPQIGRPMAPWDKLFMVLRCTGLRAGQAIRLRWDDVDLDKKLLTIRPELGKTKQERRGRVVPLAQVLVDELAGWGVRDGWLIPWPDTRDPHRMTSRRLWEATDARPDAYRQPLHGFRKGFISELARAGVLEDVRKALTGHARGTHGDVYTSDDAIMEAMREAVALVPKVVPSSVVSLKRAKGER